jgi:hypothetical protein
MGEAGREYGAQARIFPAFDRCFFAVRVATALELRLRRTPAAALGERDDLSDRADPP